MAVSATLAAIAVLLGTAALAIAIHRRPIATALIYGICLVVSLGLLVVAGGNLLGGVSSRRLVSFPVALRT